MRVLLRSDTLKRAVDLMLSAILLAAMMPVMGIIALLIRVSSGPDVIVRNMRVGRHGVAFPCLKFRSMVHDADRILALHLDSDPAARAAWDARRKLDRDPRVTPIGRLLRRTSFDELPQLLNVLRGDMSLVGPRPVQAPELRAYYSGDAGALYCSVRPGLTGLWQVSGRSRLSYAERVQLDIAYVRNASLLLDMRILCRTPWVVITARGAC